MLNFEKSRLPIETFLFYLAMINFHYRTFSFKQILTVEKPAFY